RQKQRKSLQRRQSLPRDAYRLDCRKGGKQNQGGGLCTPTNDTFRDAKQPDNGLRARPVSALNGKAGQQNHACNEMSFVQPRRTVGGWYGDQDCSSEADQLQRRYKRGKPAYPRLPTIFPRICARLDRRESDRRGCRSHVATGNRSAVHTNTHVRSRYERAFPKELAYRSIMQERFARHPNIERFVL